MLAAEPHKALRTLLRIIAILASIAGLFVLFGSGLIASFLMTNWQFAPPSFDTVLLRFVAAIPLALAYLAFAASRDPVRYVAVIDVLAFLFIVGAAVDMYAFLAWHVAPFNLAAFVIARTIVRLAIALTLIALRPRGVS
ncbi:MAG: hypothetical protein M3Z41_10905 [Candidatus Eremiobacteraeota bacterium]|nr:hypothetical protein [Candidatus Eremiobacteraeota bacterium]